MPGQVIQPRPAPQGSGTTLERLGSASRHSAPIPWRQRHAGPLLSGPSNCAAPRLRPPDSAAAAAVPVTGGLVHVRCIEQRGSPRSSHQKKLDRVVARPGTKCSKLIWLRGSPVPSAARRGECLPTCPRMAMADRSAGWLPYWCQAATMRDVLDHARPLFIAQPVPASARAVRKALCPPPPSAAIASAARLSGMRNTHQCRST